MMMYIETNLSITWFVKGKFYLPMFVYFYGYTYAYEVYSVFIKIGYLGGVYLFDVLELIICMVSSTSYWK